MLCLPILLQHTLKKYFQVEIYRTQGVFPCYKKKNLLKVELSKDLLEYELCVVFFKTKLILKLAINFQF